MLIEEMKISVKEPLIVNTICPGCGKEFSFDRNSRTGSRRKYCEVSCRKKRDRRVAKEKAGTHARHQDKISVCCTCKKEFVQWEKGNINSFCSEECAKKRTLKMVETSQVCMWCGGELVSRSKMFCSSQCRIRHRREGQNIFQDAY